MSVAFWVLLCVMAFLYGVPVGVLIGYRLWKRAPKPVTQGMTAEESARIQREREELKAEQEAFLSMMGYNADIAYGMDQDSLKGS